MTCDCLPTRMHESGESIYLEETPLSVSSSTLVVIGWFTVVQICIIPSSVMGSCRELLFAWFMSQPWCTCVICHINARYLSYHLCVTGRKCACSLHYMDAAIIHIWPSVPIVLPTPWSNAPIAHLYFCSSTAISLPHLPMPFIRGAR